MLSASDVDATSGAFAFDGTFGVLNTFDLFGFFESFDLFELFDDVVVLSNWTVLGFSTFATCATLAQHVCQQQCLYHVAMSSQLTHLTM